MAYNLVAFSFFPGTYSGFSSNLYVDTDTNGVVKWQIRVMRDSGSLQPFNNFTDATNGPRFNYTVGPNSASGAAWTYDFRTTSSKTIASGQFNTTASTYNYSVTTNGKTPLGLAPTYSGSSSTNYVAPAPTYAYIYSNPNGSSTPSGGTASSVTLGSPGTRSGYTFDYWVATGTSDGAYLGTGASGSTWTLTRATTFTASWTSNYVPIPAPGAPTGLYTSDITNSRITLNWGASSGTVSGYKVYLGTTEQTPTLASTARSYTFTGLSSSTQYTVGVAAYGPDYTGTKSTVNATTLASTFTVPNVVGQTQSVATNSLTTAGFATVTPTLITTGATSTNNLLVISQSPLSGTTATVGAAATINVYNYLLSVPNILGLTETAANTALSNAGFFTRSLSLTTSGATVANNLTVGTQNPTGGTQYNPANAVTYTIFNFLTAVPNVTGQALDLAITNLGNLGFINVTTTLDEVGATTTNVGTVKSQTPTNSATTYNPKKQTVSLVVYSLGVTGKRYTGTGFTALTTAKRYTGTEWKPLTVQKRFNGTSWIDIAN